MLSYEMNVAKSKALRDSIRNAAMDRTLIKTINFTNVRVLPKGKSHLFSISNFDVSYSLTQSSETSPSIQLNSMVKWKANVGYTYNNPSKFKQPFKNPGLSVSEQM